MNTKAAVLFRGPIRPDVDSVLENVRMLRKSLFDLEVAHTTYLATWTLPQETLARLAPAFDNLIVLNPLDQSALETELDFAPGVWNPVNAFRQYFMCQTALTSIAADDCFTHIVHSRTDAAIEFVDRDAWFNDGYCTVHINDDHPASFINDQFAVGPRETMKAAWSYGSRDRLKELLRQSVRPESVLQDMLDMSGIVPTAAPLTRWELNATRHAIPA